jgi:Flp pilus assembly protein TadD
MLRRSPSIFLAIALLAVAGCTTAPGRQASVLQSPLLDGQELFGETVPAAQQTDILAITPQMRAFVDANGRAVSVDWLRMKRLLKGMADMGYLSLQYDSGKTLTAAETFRQRAGNCLSFTNLFVALARADGLDAQFQIIDVPPMWDAADGWVMLNGHINVIVHNVRMGVPDQIGLSRDFVVDFNTPDYEVSYPRQPVDDRVAFALFYNNRGVEAMRAGDLRAAFANFKLAIATSPRVAGAWVNLGALYSRQRLYESAKSAYERALEIDPDEKSAMTNLARVYTELGNEDLAAEYQRRVRLHENLNPYYHYALAEGAYRDGEYATALSEIKSAISRKRDDHRFYFLEGLIHYRRGDVADARSAIATAERLSNEQADKQRYAGKLAALGLNNG